MVDIFRNFFVCLYSKTKADQPKKNIKLHFIFSLKLVLVVMMFNLNFFFSFTLLETKLIWFVWSNINIKKIKILNICCIHVVWHKNLQIKIKILVFFFFSYWLISSLPLMKTKKMHSLCAPKWPTLSFLKCYCCVCVYVIDHIFYENFFQIRSIINVVQQSISFDMISIMWKE